MLPRNVKWAMVLAVVWFAAAAPGVAAAGSGDGPIVRLRVEGIIDAVTARYLERGLAEAERLNARLAVIQLDTPGGLDRSMRRGVQSILGARVPVAVYVAPAGARAASAGAFLAMAAPLVALASGTNLGAAHPVDLQGKSASDKVSNDAAAYLESLARLRDRPTDWARQAVHKSRSTPAEEAVSLGVADLIAPDWDALLRGLEGREVVLSGSARKLALAGAQVRDVPPNLGERLLHALADPNVTYILFLVGIYGLIYELAAPGAILPGVAGAIAIVLALLGFDALPISLAGALFLALGAGLIILELFVVSHGVLAVGGLLSLVLGSLVLFPSPLPGFRAAASVMGGMLAATTGFVALIVWVVLRHRRRRTVSGVESLVGAQGSVKARSGDGWLVYVHGEEWLARSAEGELAPGRTVVVLAVDGLHLVVREEKGTDPQGLA